MSSVDRPSLGVTLCILSGLLFAGMLISEDVPLGEIVFFRCTFALIPLVIFLYLRGEFPGGLARKRPGCKVRFLRLCLTR